ncbi:uncharacterized protein [Nicotiana tomentosiformis]|uniref:uncharacterized protein n=1 Tax=Nicotiana tomentosiformis TaxID=4098 RepID=UPI00388C4E2C
MVTWNSPEGNTCKLNTDGSYMESINKAGAGGIVRKRTGQLVMAFASPIQFSTNNYSEVQAALQGTLWCCDQNCFNYILELDSMLVVNMILGKKGNEVADSLSKYATTITEKVTFLNEQDLPNEVRGPLKNGQNASPNLQG